MPNFGLGRRIAANGNEPERVPINWRRGFFRVWVLLSAAWMMGWGIYFTIEGLQGVAGHPGAMLIILLGPPLALMACGVAAAWAVRGFVVDD